MVSSRELGVALRRKNAALGTRAEYKLGTGVKTVRSRRQS